MSDRSILLCATALDSVDAAAALKRLQKAALPGATKMLATVGKFETRKAALTVNLDAGYPAEPALLQSYAAWAEVPFMSDPRFRDGYDVFALRRALQKETDCALAVLLRGEGVANYWPELETQLEGAMFVTSANIRKDGLAHTVAFDLRNDRSAAFLELLWDFYASGSAYAVSPYSTLSVLNIVAEALQLERHIFSR